MNIVIVAEISPGAIYYAYRRAFESMGWAVEGICSRELLQAASIAGRSRVGRRVLSRLATAAFNEALIAAFNGRRADLVFVIKGQSVSPEAVAEIRTSTGAPVVNFYPDDPFGDVSSNRASFGAAALAAYDRCFTFARHLIGAYERAGISHVHYLPFARDPAVHAPPPAGSGAEEFDVVFVGNVDAERRPWIEAAAQFRLAVFGERTLAALPRGSVARNASFFPAQYDAALPRALARGAISLNVMRWQNRLSHNMRSFESPASGAFTLSQWTPELAQLFNADVDVAFARSPGELAQRIDHFLRHPEERARIAASGWARVRDDTYTVRAQTIIDAVERPATAPLRVGRES